MLIGGIYEWSFNIVFAVYDKSSDRQNLEQNHHMQSLNLLGLASEQILVLGDDRLVAQVIKKLLRFHLNAAFHNDVRNIIIGWQANGVILL